MSVEVHFRGVMLFVAKSGDKKQLERVILPAASSADTPRDSTSAGKHADDTGARPHFAGVAVFDAKGNVLYRAEPLARNAAVTITAAGASGSTTCGFKQTHKLVPVKTVTSDGTSHPYDLDVLPIGDAELPKRAAATVTLHGGTVGPSMVSPNSSMNWSVTEAFHKAHGIHRVKPTLRCSWEANVASAELEVAPAPSGKTEKFTLLPTHKVFVYDIDDDVPTLKAVDALEKGMQPTMRVDDDFKWLYQLLRPKNGETLTKWLTHGSYDAGEPHFLPAPFYDPLPFATLTLLHVNVSTCFQGEWP